MGLNQPKCAKNLKVYLKLFKAKMYFQRLFFSPGRHLSAGVREAITEWARTPTL